MSGHVRTKSADFAICRTMVRVLASQRMSMPSMKVYWCLWMSRHHIQLTQGQGHARSRFIGTSSRSMEYMGHDIRTVPPCRKNVHHTLGNESDPCIPQSTYTERKASDNFQDSQPLCQKYILEEIEKVNDHLEHSMHIASSTGNDRSRTSNDRQGDILCWLHKTSGHGTESCSKFVHMPHEEKLTHMRQVGACFNFPTCRGMS